MFRFRAAALIIGLISSFGLGGCLFQEPRSDIPEPVSSSEYAGNYSPFDPASRLPEIKPQPDLRIARNHPRLAAWDWHLRPLSYATIRALYDNVDDLTARTKCSVNRVPSSRREQTSEYADIVFWRKPFDGRERSSIKEVRRFNPNISEIPIAKDALVFFTHKDNPVNNLSLAQIKDIYSGTITNWSDVGGQVSPIAPYQRQNMFISGFYTASQIIMYSEVMRGLKMIPAATQRVSNLSGYSRYETVEYKNHPNALGYCVRWSLEAHVPKRMLKKIKILSIDGVYPNEENIRSGLYPLALDIVAFAPKLEISTETKEVLNWLTSYEGQTYVRKVGYVPY